MSGRVSIHCSIGWDPNVDATLNYTKAKMDDPKPHYVVYKELNYNMIIMLTIQGLAKTINVLPGAAKVFNQTALVVDLGLTAGFTNVLTMTKI